MPGLFSKISEAWGLWRTNRSRMNSDLKRIEDFSIAQRKEAQNLLQYRRKFDEDLEKLMKKEEIMARKQWETTQGINKSRVMNKAVKFIV
jgi:hypothetical protein